MKENQSKSKEQNQKSNGESFADLFQQTTPTSKPFEPGRKVEVKIVGESDQYFFLDVGGKSEGYIAKAEFEDLDGNLLVSVGETIKVFFLSAKGGEKLFTSKIGAGHVSTAHLEAAFEKQIPVEGDVEKEIKGGYEIKVTGNIRAFCPFSQIGLRRVEETADLIGQKLSFKIIEYAENGRNIILSHRALLEEEQQIQREDLKNNLSEGMTVNGVITSIQKFGAFADIGGIEGLIPISEIGWSRIDDVHEVLAIGQEIEAIVLKLDWDNNRISLSLKQALPDPWEDLENSFPSGSVHIGTVTSLTKFGAFVSLKSGMDGLVHISKLGEGRNINHPREVVEIGQSLEVRIEKLDKENKRISLDLATNKTEDEKQTEDDEVKKYLSKTTKQPDSSLGSFGELLQKKLQEKSKNK